jgi:hypothetical protein
LVVSRGKDCYLRFSDIRNGKEEFCIKKSDNEGITGVTFSPDEINSVGR